MGYLLLKYVHVLLAITAVGTNITYAAWHARSAAAPAARHSAPGAGQLVKPFDFSQSDAIWSGSCLSTSAFLLRLIRVSVVSLESIELRRLTTSSLALSLRMTGTTLSAFCRCMSSCSWTYLPVE